MLYWRGIKMANIISKIIFTKKEASLISKFILENENTIKSLGQSSYDLTNKNSLTGTFSFFNFLNSEIGDLLKEKVFKFLKEQNIFKPLYIQCWANTFRKNEGIGLHKHAEGLEEYLCANIFIDGDEDIGTTYVIDNNNYYFKNTIGEITLFSSQIPHFVRKNKNDKVRISIAMDIHQNKNTAGDVENKIRYYYYT
tara:strand:- start:4014 stop:4601 length:588 start_codon:yes stop_codon:yes gene_type:complete